MPKTILIADDDPEIVESIRVRLEAVGYRVETADDGRHAITLLLEHLPDLIMLDIIMPRMNGYEVLRRLRESGLSREVPVVLLTAKRREVDVVRGFKEGADYYISKPFDIQEVVDVVRLLLGDVHPDEERAIRARL